MIKQHNESSKSTLKEHYRNHLLHYVESEDLCVGEVFKDSERLAYCESLDLESARQYCRQIIDDRFCEQSQSGNQKAPNLDAMITAMRALQNQLDKPCQLLLSSHLKNNNKLIEIDELKTCVGFHSTTEVFLKYAELARLFCDALEYLPPPQASGQDPFIGMMIQYQEPGINSTSGLSISLKPVIFEALSHITTL